MQRSLLTGARRVLVLGDGDSLAAHLREHMADATLVTLAGQGGQQGRPELTAVLGEAGQLPFKRWVFDLALVYDLLPRLDAPEHLLNGVLRCVRPGGILAIGHPAGPGTPPKLPQLVKWLSDFGARTEAAEREDGEMFVMCIAP